MRRHRSLVAAAVTTAVLATVTLAACTGDGDGAVRTDDRAPTTATTVATPAGTPTTPSATVGPDAEGVELAVYFTRGEHLGTARRRVAPTRAVARAALEQLLAGPNDAERAAGMATAIPAGTRLLGVDVADGVATVDLSGEFESGGGTLSMQARLGQVVFTLTQFPTVDAVRLRLDGEPVTSLGGEGILVEEPVGRADVAAVTPMILVESVAPGDTVASPVRIAGISNTFENNVRLRVVAADGTVLADTFTTGQGEMGTWGPFEARVTFEQGAHTEGTIVVWEDSPRDGSMINVVEIPVRFA